MSYNDAARWLKRGSPEADELQRGNVGLVVALAFKDEHAPPGYVALGG